MSEFRSDPLAIIFSPLFDYFDTIDWTQPSALSVSGGGDSVALLAAVASYRQAKGLKTSVHVFTVDHQLRADADVEIGHVARLCQTYDMTHHVLVWEGDKPSAGLMQAARQARLTLMEQACQRHDLRQIVLAHTLDDQAETLLMRARRGGLRGHAAMAPLSTYRGIIIYRPWLAVRREYLRSLLRRAQIGWMEDPSNHDTRFERVRVRQRLAYLEATQLNAHTLARYAHIMGRWRAIMARDIADIIASSCTLDIKLGMLTIKLNEKTINRTRIGQEFLREIVRFIGGEQKMVCAQICAKTFLQIRRYHQKFLGAQRSGKTEIPMHPISIGRCLMRPQKDGTWLLARTTRHLPKQIITTSKEVIWDGRFIIKIHKNMDETFQIIPDAKHPQKPWILPVSADYGSQSFAAVIRFSPQVMRQPISLFDALIFKEFNKMID